MRTGGAPATPARHARPPRPPAMPGRHARQARPCGYRPGRMSLPSTVIWDPGVDDMLALMTLAGAGRAPEIVIGY